MLEARAGSELAERAAEALRDTLAARLRLQERTSLALSGGQTPWGAFRLLAEAPIDWSRVDVYQVDERVAPEGDPARNLTGLRAALLDHVPAVCHAMPVEEADLQAAAQRYAALLPEALDVVHLGLGDDGHTASLVPGDPVLDVFDRGVAVSQPYRGHRRMTLTYPTLSSAKTLVWIVGGDDKAWALEKLRAADSSIPAGRVPQARALLFTDEVVTTERTSS